MINKSELMLKAWELYRATKKELTNKILDEQYYSPKYPTRIVHKVLFVDSLVRAWEIMKNREARKEARKLAEKKSVSIKNRRVELSVIAEANKLNHGKSWLATEEGSYKLGYNSHWEGEFICYVYAS